MTTPTIQSTHPGHPLAPFAYYESLTCAQLPDILEEQPLPAPAPSTHLASSFPLGHLTLLAGPPSSGKSLLTLHLAAQLSNAAPPTELSNSQTPKLSNSAPSFSIQHSEFSIKR